MSDFSDRLNIAIKERNVKASRLAEATGLNKGTISNYIAGKYMPKQDKVVLLAETLRVNPMWLMGYDVPMDEDSFTESLPSGKKEKSYYEISFDEEMVRSLSKEEWSESYDRIQVLPEDMKIEIYKRVLLAVAMANMMKDWTNTT